MYYNNIIVQWFLIHIIFGCLLMLGPLAVALFGQPMGRPALAGITKRKSLVKNDGKVCFDMKQIHLKPYT